MAWPDGGPWLVVSTSRNANWALAAAALAAAATSRVAVLRVGGPGLARSALPAVLTDHVSVYVEAGPGDADPADIGGVRTDDLVRLTQALARTHGLVLVGGDVGLLVPIGAGDGSLADVAWALQAPVVVVTDTGPDAAHHTTLLLETLSGRGLSAAVIVLDGPSKDGPSEAGPSEDGPSTNGQLPVGLLDALPVAPAGRVPVEVADQPERFRSEAAGWLDPMLHATRGRPVGKPPSAPAAEPAAVPAVRRTVSGKRVVLGLLGAFVAMALIACAVAILGANADSPGASQWTVVEQHPRNRDAWTEQVPPTATTPPVRLSQRPASAACPPHQGKFVAGRPRKAVVARVNAAWRRIETWLAKNAPATRASLRKPASLTRISAMQQRMSVTFPPELAASLLRHDGVSSGAAEFTFAPFYTPISTAEIGPEWQVNCEVLANAGGVDDEWWDAAFVPFAAAGDGGSLVVDQRAGGHGRVGEFYPEDGTSFERWPASVTALLESTASSLETGKPIGGYRPRVEKRALVWDAHE